MEAEKVETEKGLVGETAFMSILKNAVHCWKQTQTEEHLKKFVRYGIQFSEHSTHRFRKALDFLAQNEDSFPSIAKLKEAIAKVPKTHIDFIEKLDVRANCSRCNSSGLQRLINAHSGHEAYGYCDCQIGNYIYTRGSKGVLRASELINQGYVTMKYYREGKK